MAALYSPDGAGSYALGARTIVGRSSTCQVRPSGLEVSAIHAEIAWNGRSWTISDLGSRNGTFVDGRLIPPGQRVPIDSGACIAFGRSRAPYRLADASPPGPMAISSRGEVVRAEAGLLCLPSSEEPAATIFQRPDGAWTIDTRGIVATTADQAIIVVNGRGWRLCLPELLDMTRENRPSRLHEMEARLLVSRDQESITLALAHQGTEVVLEPRSHSALLLALARTRLVDKRNASLTAAEQGWMHRTDLLTELRIDPDLLNVWVHRARQQVARAQIPGAAAVVERRAGTGQLRIGLENIEIERG